MSVAGTWPSLLAAVEMHEGFEGDGLVWCRDRFFIRHVCAGFLPKSATRLLLKRNDCSHRFLVASRIEPGRNHSVKPTRRTQLVQRAKKLRQRSFVACVHDRVSYIC